MKLKPVAYLHTEFSGEKFISFKDQYPSYGWTKMPLYTADQIRAAVEEMRERCAKVCADMLTAETVSKHVNGRVCNLVRSGIERCVDAILEIEP